MICKKVKGLIILILSTYNMCFNQHFISTYDLRDYNVLICFVMLNLKQNDLQLSSFIKAMIVIK